MALDVNTPPRLTAEPSLPADFAQRLEGSLRLADQERRRRRLLNRAGVLLPIVLLVGPLVAWRLMLASPAGEKVTIAALAWLTFLLDVGVHVDTAVLSYLGLTALPSIIGVLLLALISVWPLTDLRSEH